MARVVLSAFVVFLLMIFAVLLADAALAHDLPTHTENGQRYYYTPETINNPDDPHIHVLPQTGADTPITAAAALSVILVGGVLVLQSKENKR